MIISSTRRQLLKIASGVGIGSLSGCLRLSQEDVQSEQSEPETKTEATPSSQDEALSQTETPSENSGPSYEVSTFEITDSIKIREEEGRATTEPGDFVIRTPDNSFSRLENGQWDGDEEIFGHQVCARFSFDLVEEDTAIASTVDKILITAYRYLIAQTDEAVFVTYHPSVGREWETSLVIPTSDKEYNLSPRIRSDSGVFEFNFANTEIDPGTYDWRVEITPPDSFTISLGEFNNQQVTIKPEAGSEFPSRETALSRVGEISNESATSVEAPQSGSQSNLSIISSGHRGRQPPEGVEETIPYILSRSAAVECRDTCEVGPGGTSIFRINNLTSETSLMYSWKN